MSDEKLYAYRGLDHNKKSAYGFLVAGSQEQAEERCTAMGVQWEAVYLNGTQPPAQNLERMKAISEAARRDEAVKAQVAASAQPAIYQTPMGPVAKPPAPSETRGVPADLQQYAGRPTIPPDVAQQQGELQLYQPTMKEVQAQQRAAAAPPAPAASIPAGRQLSTSELAAVQMAQQGESRTAKALGRRETLIVGGHQQIKDQIDVLLDRHKGIIKSVNLLNGLQGHLMMAVVIEHDRS